MSLMNQVLRDLQHRQTAPADAVLQAQISPVAAPAKYLARSRALWVGILLSTVVLGLLAATLNQTPLPGTGKLPATVESTGLQKAARGGLPGVQLTAVRLETELQSSRLLLEFSQVPGLEPEILQDGRRLRVLLPELIATAHLLPPTGLSDALVRHLSLVKLDHLWQLQVDFSVDVRVERASIRADLLHGERLAFDFFPLAPQVSSLEKKIPVLDSTPGSAVVPVAAVKPQLASKLVPKAPALIKQDYAPSPAQKAEDLYRQGVAASQNEYWAEAVEFWLQALSLQPGHLMARKGAIIGLLPVDLRRAEELFSTGVTLQDSLDFRKWYARTLLPILGPVPALKVLAGQIVPVVKDAEYVALQAALWQQSGEYSKSEQAYQELLTSFPDNAIYLFGLAVALDQQARGKEALSYYRLASGGLQAHPQSYASQRMEALAAGDVD